MTQEQVMTLMVWLTGGSMTIIVALIGVIYSGHTREINKLRDWRHDHADPAIRLTGYLKERVEAIEERM